MNVERFHSLIVAVADELEDTKEVALMSQLAQGLRQMVQDPSQPAYQQQVSDARSELSEALAAAESNEFSSGWRQSLEELGIAQLLGADLLARIDDVFLRNELTASTAADELEPIAARLNQLETACNAVVDGLEFFRIGTEDLDPGSFEISFLIPRREVNDELGELGAEFQQLKRLLGPVLELTVGGRPDVEVRSISSSAFEVFLVTSPVTALTLAKVIESLVTSYEKLTNIRVNQQRLKEDGVPDEALAPVREHAGRLMERAVEQVVEELLEERADGDAGRRNELRIELTMSLNGLANRIDRGYGIDVRAGELPDGEDEDDAVHDDEVTRASREVLARQSKLRYLKLEGPPILGLPEAPREDGDEQT